MFRGLPRSASLALGTLLFGAVSCSAGGEPTTGESEGAFRTPSGAPTCDGIDFRQFLAEQEQAGKDGSYQCQVSAGLSRSSQPDSKKWLPSLVDPAKRHPPFRSVVNLRGEPHTNGEAPVVRALGMTPRNIPVRDKTAPTRAQIVEFLEFVTDPAHQPALVHCHAGQGRTGTFVAAYRMIVQHRSVAAALSEADEFGVNDEQHAFLVTEIAAHLGDAEFARFRGAPGSGPVRAMP